VSLGTAIPECPPVHCCHFRFDSLLSIIEHAAARLNDNVLLEFYVDGSGPSADDFPISQDQYSEL
jgi:hypothetical protein